MYVQFWNFAKEIYIYKVTFINFGKKFQLNGLKKKPIQVKMTPFTWQLLILIKVSNFLKNSKLGRNNFFIGLCILMRKKKETSGIWCCIKIGYKLLEEHVM
jgi:hypothetical protein